MSEFFHGIFEIGTMDLPRTRSNFIALCGGRAKKLKNRRGDCYNDSEYRRPVLRIKGFNMPELCDYFDDIAARKQEDQKTAKEATRLEAMAQEEKTKLLEVAKKKAARKARRNQKHHQHDGYKQPTHPVLVYTVRTGSKLPPGRVVKDPSGKLIFQPYEEALAA